LACQDEFFVNNLLYVKENDEHALGFALHLSRLNRTCHSIIRVRLMLSFPIARLIIAKVSVALFLRFGQNLMLFL
jgi:hypothetical protein